MIRSRFPAMRSRCFEVIRSVDNLHHFSTPHTLLSIILHAIMQAERGSGASIPARTEDAYIEIHQKALFVCHGCCTLCCFDNVFTGSGFRKLLSLSGLCSGCCLLLLLRPMGRDGCRYAGRGTLLPVDQRSAGYAGLGGRQCSDRAYAGNRLSRSRTNGKQVFAMDVQRRRRDRIGCAWHAGDQVLHRMCSVRSAIPVQGSQKPVCIHCRCGTAACQLPICNKMDHYLHKYTEVIL